MAEDGRLEGVLPLLLQHDIARTTQAENAVVLLHPPADVEEEQDAGLNSSSDRDTSDEQGVVEVSPANGGEVGVP